MRVGACRPQSKREKVNYRFAALVRGITRHCSLPPFNHLDSHLNLTYPPLSQTFLDISTIIVLNQEGQRSTARANKSVS